MNPLKAYQFTENMQSVYHEEEKDKNKKIL